MKYNFDKIAERKNTNSVKFDFYKEYKIPEDAIPLWVADMDFEVCEEVKKALLETAEHGVFGYSDTKDDYFKALENWYFTYFDWKIKEQWVIKTPGVVYAIALAIKALTKENESILIQKPVYYPFSNIILKNNRKLINNPLINKDEKYYMDFEDFENKIVSENVKLFILCSPHNPVGRVWTKEELEKIGDICLKHNVLIVSDEIHSDFVFKNNKHTVFSNIKPEFSDITITCTAPSKTFNIAGLQLSNIIIQNADIREKFNNEVLKNGLDLFNPFAIKACEASYKYGRQWLEELKTYLENNIKFVKEFLLENLPQIKLIEPEGTYLLWLDFRNLKLNQNQLDDLIINKAKLWLDSGTMFGEEGEGFQRINIACSKSILEKALLQLKNAVEK